MTSEVTDREKKIAEIQRYLELILMMDEESSKEVISQVEAILAADRKSIA
jgi:hypothetical protein